MGCFSASFSGEEYYSVALDECHEMQINLKTKNALNSLSQSSLAKLTFYLPYRAETIHNFKRELGFQKDLPHHTEKGIKYVSVEEETIIEYFAKLEQSTLFMVGDKKILHHIFFNLDATDKQTDSLMNYRRYGQEDLVNYVKKIT